MDNEFLLNIISTLNKQLSKRQLKSDLKALDDSMYVKVIAKLSTTLSKRQLKKSLKQLNDLYVKIGADLKVDKNLKGKLQSRIKELQDSIAEIEIRTKVNKTKLGTEADSAKKEVQQRVNRTPVSIDLEIKKNKAVADIEYLGKRFSKLFSNVSAKQKYQNLLTSALSISDGSQLKSVRAQISAFTSELKANGLAAKSLADRWKSLIDKGKDLFSAASIISAVFSQMRESVSTFLGLDTAMTNLYKVQDQITSRDQFSGLLSKWNKLAQDLSLTTESLINSSAEWSKIGFNLDMSEQLAQITAIFEKTAEISNEKANSTLISVAQAFPEIDDLGEDDYVERVQAIGDKINKVGNEFSIDSEGVSDALQNSSAALRMANNSLDESIAIVTAANKIFQSPDEVGNMSKILSARLRGQRGELEKLNEDTDGMIESVNKIQTQILNLTHNKVNIFEADNETLKSTYDIIWEIGEIYNTLSDKDQADLLEIIAGKQRMSAVASLIMNYKELEKIKNASMDADNSMQQEYDRYLESAEAHIVTFKEKLIEAYSAFMGGDLIKYAADTGSAILDLVNSTDLLRHGLLAVLALNFGKGISAIGAGVVSTVNQMNTLGAALQQVKNLPLDGGLRKNIVDEIGEATKNLTEQNLKLLLSQEKLNKSDTMRILKAHGLTAEEARAKLEKMGLTTATNAQTAANTAETTSTFTLTGALNVLKASALGAWAAFKAAFAANPIGMALTIATTAISVFTTLSSKVKQTAEEIKQLGEEFKSTASDIDSYKSKIEKLRETVDSSGASIEDVTNARQELMQVQDELIEKYGMEAGSIDAITKAINGEVNALEELKRSKYEETKAAINEKGIGDYFVDFVTDFKNGHIQLGNLLMGNPLNSGIEESKSKFDELVEDMETREVTIPLTLDENINKLIESAGFAKTDYGFAFLGSAYEIQDALQRLKDMTGKYDLSGSDFADSLQEEIISVNELISANDTLYRQHILYDKVLDKSSDKKYDGQYNLLNEAAKEYNAAKITGDEAEMKSAAEKYAGILHDAMENARGNHDFDVAEYFKRLYPTIQKEVSQWQFQAEFRVNTDNIKNDIDAGLSKLGGWSSDDILSFNAQNATDKEIEGYGILEECAGRYNMDIMELISLLQQLGVVQSENYQKLVSLFGEDNIRKLTPDELAIAYKIENTGDMTFEELQDAIAQARQAAEDIKPISFKEAWKSLDNTDNESLKDLKEDLLELAKQGKLTVAEFKKTTGANTWLKEIGISAEEAVKKINKLKEVSSADQLASMKSGISSISEALGKKRENLSKKKTAGDGIGIDDLSSMPEDLKLCRKEYEKFCEVLGNGSSTMAECREAADKLAAAYVNNGNFLAKLTEKNKDYYISVLQEMGVQNAEAIVTNELAKQKGLAAIKTADLTNMTVDEIKQLIDEKGKTDDARNAMRLFAIEKIYANSNGLDTSGDVQQLSNLLEAFGIVIPAVQKYREFMANYDPNSNMEHIKEFHKNNAINGINEAKDALSKKTATVKVPTVAPAPAPSGGSSSGGKGTSTKAKESTQVIDWIGRRLDVLQDKIDLTKAKFENLFAIKKQKNNLNAQIKQTTKLLNNQQKAVAKYQKKADSIKLPKSLKSKVQNGAITGKVSALIKEYGEDTAKKITDYQDYIDKIKDLKKAAQEAKKAVRELKEERNQLYIDRADSKLSMLDAKAEAALNAKGIKSAEATNKVLQKKIKWTKQYYNYQIKNAKLEKDSTKVMELQAQKKKALLDIKVGKQQNLSDEAEANISRIDAQSEIARDSEGNTSAEETNKLLQEKIKYTKQYYNRQIKIANLEGDSVKAAELQAQKEKEILDIQVEKQQNLADEAEAKYNLNQQYETNAASAKDKNKYEAKSMKNLEEEYKHLIQIAKLEGDVTEKKRLQAELEAKRKESYQKQYDNIKAEYDNKTALNDADISIVKARIETLEAAGKTVSKSMYEGLMKMYSNRKEILLEDFEKLKEAGKDFEYGSDAWCKWQTDLLVAGQGIEECTQETINLQKAINALDFKKFTLMAAQLDATKSHLDFLVDMLSHKDLTSKESGGLTDEGMATISLRFANIENYAKIRENAQADLAKFYEQHANGEDLRTEEEALAYEKEKLDIIRDTYEAEADEKDAIIDLVENALQLQIDAIDELIEKKRKALATEKDLYEYQRKVAKQTKNIALIQKQIAALSGDKSEEARARIQKLQLSLEEAQEDLKETEYDKWHSDQEDMLDNLADEVEDFWEKVMDDLKKNLDTSLGNIERMISENPEAVARALDELGLGDALSIITTYNPDGTHTNKTTDYNGNTYESTYDETGENVKNQFKIDKNPAEGIVESNEGVKGTLDEISNTSSDIKDEIMDLVHKGEGDKLPDKNNTDGKDPKDEIMDMVNSGKGDKLPSTGTWKPENTLDSGVEDNGTLKSNKNDNSLTAMVRKLLDSALHKPKTDAEKKRMESDPLLKYLSKNYSGRTISKANEAKLGAMLGIPVNKDNITEAKAKQIKNALKNAGFAKGGIAETLNKVALENGDDGWVTLQKGEAVLNKEQTEIMQRLAERGLELAEPQYKLTDEQIRHFQESVGLIDYSDMLPKFDIPASNTVNTSVNIGDINVHLDGSGVVDPKSFCDTFRRSNEMQRAVQDATVGQIKKSYAQTLIL